MALQQLSTDIPWPNLVARTSAAQSLATVVTVDAAGEYSAIIICARQAMTISHVGFLTGTVAGSPTADVRIETVATTGLPSGTLWATNTNIVTGTLVSDTFALHALTASASIAAGQVFAVVIKYNSGTSFIHQGITGLVTSVSGLPYQVTNTGTPTKLSTVATAPIAVLGSSATAFYKVNNLIPLTTITANSFNNTNGARRGVRVQIPFPCRCVGFRIYEGTAAGNKNVAIYDDAGSELSSSSTAFDGDHSANLAGSAQSYYFDNPVTLAANTWYRAAIEPSSATNCSITTLTLPSADYRTAYPGGTNFFYTTFASGSWTDSATDQVPMMDLLLDQLDDGAGGAAGGLIRHPGMRGGLNA